MTTKCISGQTTCLSPSEMAYCSFLMTDAANCGACGKLLPPGQMCINGKGVSYFTVPAWECDMLKVTGTYTYCPGSNPPICIAGTICPG
jgi:hypothetical protein